MDSLWAARKTALWASLATRPEGTQMRSTDVAVPMSRLADIVEIVKDRANRMGLHNSVLGHVGDGNFHQMLMYRPEEKEAVEECVNIMMADAVHMEGTVSVRRWSWCWDREISHFESAILPPHRCNLMFDKVALTRTRRGNTESDLARR